MKHWKHFSKKSNELVNTMACWSIKSYQVTLGPFIGGGCRFYPSCSHYALDAYKNHDFFEATRFVFKRLSRCHPLGGAGYDPVPEKRTK
ncbi:MAG: membrane protein insertion efficiency factor YidD [Bdellovibrionaceae bacterium]|nr:membrane protein insertion efficiency factor YidD [Pseudobdellovibrionaceae bacterium]